MVVCDQPFEEVDRPEFCRLLEYTHFRPSLQIPHRAAMKTRIMKMGEDTIEGTRKMIAVSINLVGVTCRFEYGVCIGVRLQG